MQRAKKKNIKMNYKKQLINNPYFLHEGSSSTKRWAVSRIDENQAPCPKGPFATLPISSIHRLTLGLVKFASLLSR